MAARAVTTPAMIAARSLAPRRAARRNRPVSPIASAGGDSDRESEDERDQRQRARGADLRHGGPSRGPVREDGRHPTEAVIADSESAHERVDYALTVMTLGQARGRPWRLVGRLRRCRVAIRETNDDIRAVAGERFDRAADALGRLGALQDMAIG